MKSTTSAHASVHGHVSFYGYVSVWVYVPLGGRLEPLGTVGESRGIVQVPLGDGWETTESRCLCWELRKMCVKHIAGGRARRAHVLQVRMCAVWFANVDFYTHSFIRCLHTHTLNALPRSIPVGAQER